MQPLGIPYIEDEDDPQLRAAEHLQSLLDEAKRPLLITAAASAILVAACTSSEPGGEESPVLPETQTTLVTEDTTTTTSEVSPSTVEHDDDDEEEEDDDSSETVPQETEAHLTETRFSTYEDIQATTEPVLPSELIINADYPKNIEEASAIVNQFMFNYNVSKNLGYGINTLSDPLFYEPESLAWNGFVADFKYDADLVGVKRVYESDIDYLLIEELSGYFGFNQVSGTVFSIGANSLKYDNNSPPDVYSEREGIIFHFINTDVTLEDGSTFSTWQLVRESQL